MKNSRCALNVLITLLVPSTLFLSSCAPVPTSIPTRSPTRTLVPTATPGPLSSLTKDYWVCNGFFIRVINKVQTTSSPVGVGR